MELTDAKQIGRSQFNKKRKKKLDGNINAAQGLLVFSTTMVLQKPPGQMAGALCWYHRRQL